MPHPVIINGCSSGMGLVTATYLAERGVRAYATVRTAEDAARVGAIDNVDAFVCDVNEGAQGLRCGRSWTNAATACTGSFTTRESGTSDM